jgi:hypothetical protein
MKHLLVALNAKYAHKAPAVWMLRKDCALCKSCARQGIVAHALEVETNRLLTTSPAIFCVCG